MLSLQPVTTGATASDSREPRPWLAHYPDGLDWHAEIPVKPVYTLLDEGAARFAERPCIDFLDRRYLYRDVADLARRAARGLADLGVGPCAKIGLFLPNCPYFVIVYHAVLRTGATVVNFNPLYAEAELAHQIDDSETDIMVTLDLTLLYGKLAPLVGRTRLKRIVVCRMVDILPAPKSWLFQLSMQRRLAQVQDDDRHTTWRRLIDNDGAHDPPAIDPASAIAVLQYTGGTTGAPKAAMLTHAGIYANAVQSSRWFAAVRTEGPESVLGVLPLFHVFAMTCVMNFSLIRGAAMILVPRFQLKSLLRTIHRKKPTAMPVVPTILTAINGFDRLARYDLTSLRYCISGGAPLPLEVKQQFEARSTCKVVEGYGLSESSPVLCCNPVQGAKQGSVGLPYPGTTIEIVSLDAPERVLPIGETGEICGRGPQLMAGYWKQPEETAQALRGGRLHTGDVGRLDADGFLYISDRIKEMINAGGFKIYPRIVEAALYSHPDVAECAVIGVGDAYRGQTVKAVIVPQPGRRLTGEDLTRHLAGRLSPIELPKLYEFRTSLPKTAIGKIDKKVLVAEHAAASGPDQESKAR